MPQTPARWPPQTRQYAEVQRDDFYANLRVMASVSARHEKAEYVLTRHVDQAFDALGRLGLTIRPWYKRPELEVSGGLILLGLGVNSQDIITGLFGHNDKIDMIVCGAMIGLFVAGSVLWAHGWVRGNG